MYNELEMTGRLHNPVKIDRQQVLDYHQKFPLANFTIQFSERAYSHLAIHDLNALCEICKAKLSVRFYDEDDFDASLLKLLPAVRSLVLDNISSIKNIEGFNHILNLESLVLYIKEPPANILSLESLRNISTLSLSFSNKYAYNLAPLLQFSFLKELRYFEEDPADVEITGKISTLEKLDLWHFKNSSKLSFVNELPNLTELSLVLGGRKDISEIQSSSLKKLYLNQVRGFQDMTNLEGIPSLEALIIHDQAQFKQIDISGVTQLKELSVFNCKNLVNIKGIEQSQLERLTLNNTGIDFDEFVKRKFPGSLKIFGFYTGKVRRDKEIYEQLKSMGYFRSIVEMANEPT